MCVFFLSIFGDGDCEDFKRLFDHLCWIKNCNSYRHFRDTYLFVEKFRTLFGVNIYFNFVTI